MKSNLVFNDLTCIDHATIDSKGQLFGGSYMLSVILSGEVSPGEEVVVDFSKGKKLIKAAIDSQQSGFDHKLWLFNDSDVKVNMTAEKAYITGDTLEIVATRDAVCRVNCNYGDIKAIEKTMADYLKVHLEENHEGIKFEVSCVLSTSPHTLGDNNDNFMFRYAHGLPNSSSYGCQNIAHGHLSYFKLLDENYKSLHYTGDQEPLAKVLLEASITLDGMYFVHAKNVVSRDDNGLKVKYVSSRGEFMIILREPNKIVVLETDTTIEHLIEFIRTWFTDARQYGAKYLVVSEGLTKGAVVEL